MAKQRGGLVYSTDAGRMCPACRRPLAECTCGSSAEGPAGDGIVRIRRETQGRKGQGVTVISGVPVDAGELKKLAKSLKQKCGSGGTVKDGNIEIQGDHRATLGAELRARGFTVRG